MRNWKTSLILTSAAMAVFSQAAFAQDASADNSQTENANIHGQMDLTSTGEIHGDASTVAIGYGNVVSATHTGGNLDFDNSQIINGSVDAVNNIDVYIVDGETFASTTAYGNSAEATTDFGLNDTLSNQISNGTTNAITNIDVGYSTETVVATTTSAANVLSVTNDQGDISAFANQVANANVTATADVDMCCNHEHGTIITSATGNSYKTEGSTSTNYTGATQYTNGTTIRATSDTYSTIGYNIDNSATATGNSATVHNEFGFATLGREGSELYQENNSGIRAESYVTLDDWIGYGNSTAYGVGNSALISNIGSDTGLYTIQNNRNSVDSYAGLTGTSVTNGTGYASATSIGNAASAYLCSTCGEAAINGAVNQTNDGLITARGVINVGGHTGSISGAASAIGNTASFHNTNTN